MKKLSHILCLVSFIVFLTQSGYSQKTEESEHTFSKAEKLLQSYKYDEALPLYLSILDSEPDNANINYRVGQCYMNLQGKEREALPYLQLAVEEVNEDYKAGDTKNYGASPHAWLLLGDAYHRDENLPEASKAYNKYKEYVGDDKKELAVVSERIVGLGVSQGEVRDHPRDVMLSNMGESINTKSSEYNIVFSGDLKTRVFNRYEKRSDIVFYSAFKNGEWSDPVDISEQIGSQGDMYATSLSFDGKELYLILLTAYDADIYVSEFKDGQWSYAENIGRNINSKYVESNACISADGNTLYFSSDRANSIGGFDIFYSKRVDGKWEKSESIGEIINTKSNEESPFITESGKTLYFSSDRPGSIGRMDVYFSRLENDVWTAPENLGMPYNTVDDDVAFKYYEKYRKSYIARDLPGGFGKLDLYMIQSGADRQRELMDYMASIAPPKPVEEVAETPVVAETVMEETEEPLPNETTKADLPDNPEPTPIPIVAELTTTAIVPEAIEDDKPEIVEEIADNVEEEVVEELPSEPIFEPIIDEVAEPVEEPVIQNKPVPPASFEGDYTVQILALIFPKRISNYNGLDQLQVRSIAGDDGYTRFIYGQYKSRTEAVEALKIVFSKGYKDAYVRKTSDINNFE